MSESPFTRFYADLQNRLDPVAVVGQHVKLRQGTRSYSGLCPFHADSNQSFHIYLDDKHYHCFGCQAHGNLIDFVAKMRNLEYREAAKQLAASVGLEVPSTARQRQDAASEAIFTILSQANQLYRERLSKTPIALGYLADRGLTPETIERFTIGYAPPGWQFLSKELRKHPESTLARTGLVSKSRDDRSYDVFRDRIMFPIRDYQGRILGFGGRVFQDAESDVKIPKYINSPETPVFKKSSVLYGDYELNQEGFRHERILLVEGYMDVIGLSECGITYALGILGTAVNQNHLRQAFAHTQEVVVCFDGDAAGKTAAERGLAEALPELTSGRILRFMFLPAGSDPDSHIRDIGKVAFEKLIAESPTVIDFLKTHLLEGQSIQDLNRRIKFVEKAVQLLKKIPHEITRSILIDELVKTFPDLEIQGQLNRVFHSQITSEGESNSPRSSNSPSASVKPLRTGELDSRSKLAEKQIVGSLLFTPSLCWGLSEQLMGQWREIFGDSLLYVLWRDVRLHELESESAVLACFQGSPIGEELHQIHSEMWYKYESKSKHTELSQPSLSNDAQIVRLKTAIETTISRRRIGKNRRDNFVNSDVYRSNRRDST